MAIKTKVRLRDDISVRVSIKVLRLPTLLVSSLCCEGKELDIIHLLSNSLGILQERIMLTHLDDEHGYTAKFSQFYQPAVSLLLPRIILFFYIFLQRLKIVTNLQTIL